MMNRCKVPSHDKAMVLHVDDEVGELVKFLEQFDEEKLDRQYDLMEFRSSDSFLKTLITIQQRTKRVIQAVVLDYFIDGLTGEDLARICRKLVPEARIIMRSSLYGDQDDEFHQKVNLASVRAYGAHTFIPKHKKVDLRKAIEGELPNLGSFPSWSKTQEIGKQLSDPCEKVSEPRRKNRFKKKGRYAP